MAEILLIESAEPVSESVIEANKLRMDPLSTNKLVSTSAQIKDKINAKMSSEGRYLYNDQFSDVTICDANGNNLVNNEYYSFIAKDKDKLYIAKNDANTDVVEFSIPEQKIVKEELEVVPNETVVQVHPVQEEVKPVEESVTVPVQETVVPETKPVTENINEGFAPTDIAPNELNNIYGAGIEVPETKIEQEVSAPVTDNIETENVSFDEISEETPVEEVESPVEETINEIPEDSKESDLEMRLNELNNEFTDMNSLMDQYENREANTENRFDSIAFHPDKIERVEDTEDTNTSRESTNDGKDIVEDASRILANFSDIVSKRDEVIREKDEENQNLRRELEEMKKEARSREIRDSKEINYLKSENREQENTIKKQSARIDSLEDVVDLYKRKEEETRRSMKTLARAIKSYEALTSGNDIYNDEEEYSYRRIA